MRLPLVRRGLLLFTLALLTSRATADEVVLTGGSRLSGVVLEQSGEGVRLLLPSGAEITLAPADVQEVVADPDAPAGDRVVRYASGKNAKREGLETALIHYVHPETGQRVDLVGAVHIGDMAYYREVQRLLEAADLVLYELVKPDEGEAQAAEAGANPVRDFQTKMARWFNFAFQLDGIAYDRPHFVHADMTMKQFRAAAERTGATQLLDALGSGETPEPKADPAPPAPKGTPPAPPAAVGTSPVSPTPAGAGGGCPSGSGAPAPVRAPQVTGPATEPATAPAAEAPKEGASGGAKAGAPKAPSALAGIGGQVKMLENVLKSMGIEDEKRGPQVRKTVKGFLGRMLGSMGPQMGMLLGNESNELLIVKRNEVAIERLKEVPASAKSVAIFYGAAHLPDLEDRIEALGYKRVGARWLLAWDMR